MYLLVILVLWVLFNVWAYNTEFSEDIHDPAGAVVLVTGNLGFFVVMAICVLWEVISWAIS